MIRFIQKSITRPLALKRFKNRKRNPSFVPLKEAGSIGILADFRNPGHPAAVIQFSKSLHKMNLRPHLLMIIPEKRKELNVFDYERNFPGMPVELICQDELSWLKDAPRKLTEPFIASRFDILFLLDTSPNYSLEKILLSSSARMYAGISGAAGGTLDFEIELSTGCDLANLTENLLKYLQSIHSKPEQKKVDSSQNLFST